MAVIARIPCGSNFLALALRNAQALALLDKINELTMAESNPEFAGENQCLPVDDPSCLGANYA